MGLVNAFGDIALEATLAELSVAMKQRYDPVLTARSTYVAPGTYTLVDPPPNNRVRSVWLYAQARSSLGTGVALVTFALGTHSYAVELTGGQPFMHSAVWEGGLNEELTVTIDNAPVLVNCDYRVAA